MIEEPCTTLLLYCGLHYDRRVSQPLELVLLVVTGLVAGALNVVAGGGSFLTLPVLLFLGLPAGVANATNRVGVLAQNVSGVWGFHRHGALDWAWALRASAPSVLGAGLGAWLALRVPDFAFTRLLSLTMLAVTLWSIWRNRSGAARPATARHEGRPPDGGPLAMLGFFAVGIYGGFIQAGVGFFLLALTTAAGLDLIRGNAVKLLSVLLMTVLSLLIFGGAGAVNWPLGAALAVGNFLGGLIGVRMAVLKGQVWLERVVTGTIIVFAVLLWLT